LTDPLIPDVPEEIAAGTTGSTGDVRVITVTDLNRLAEICGDLADGDVMRQAWL
jgi:hypothetical protein